jgi:putative transcriptional regulator
MVTVIHSFSLLLLAGAAAAPRAEPVKPGQGVFLVAKPSIDGGPFWQSVVLLLQHGDSGTLGLIINRATDVPLSEALPDLEREEPKLPLHFGGPVALDGLLYLFVADERPDGVAHVMGNMYFSGDRKILDRLLEKETDGHRLKIFLGHSGWAPGQLLGEIARGSWELVRADMFTVFEKDPEKIWKDLSHAGTVVASSQGSEPSPRASTSEKTSSTVHSFPR